MSRLEDYLQEKKSSVEKALLRYLPGESEPPLRIHQAMRYSVLAGGKRVRPILAIAAAEACGAGEDRVMPTACALEMIHTYSLIHDDLPCMDDDDLRRGRPTNHKVFGETMAVLAGDALQALAFRLVADNANVPGVDPAAAAEAGALIAASAGSMGMVGGQAADILAEGRQVEEADVAFIHERKTGALIRASVLSGAIVAGADKAFRQKIAAYGESLGLLFQVVDDILNVEGDGSRMGKSVGSDKALGKATYPAVVGLAEAKRRAQMLAVRARESLATLGGKTDILSDLADYVLKRES